MTDSTPAFFRALNEKQKEAVEHTDGPLIVLAGAGSGKTKMLTSRICNLVERKGIPAWNILAVTFTNKAAGEMRERVEKMLNESRGQLGVPEIGTFHSVCVRMLRREMANTPFTRAFVIYDDADQLTLIKGVMEKLSIDDKSFSPKGIQASINRAKCDALEPDDFKPEHHDIFGRQVKRVYEAYQKELFANNAIDFGEILCLPYRLLRDNPEIRARYQQRYRYIHVDEYQDTNRAQYLLLSMLASKRNGGHENICVVGDEDQSIYKWRGADINNIMDFETDYPGAKVVKLEQNYRSTKNIIEAASHVIRNNTQRKDKTLWTANEGGLPLVRFQLPDERVEAEVVASEIKRQAQHEGYKYGDFAIFYRTNAQSRQFEDVFRREKLPYQVVGGLRFYDRKEVKDVMAYFKVVMNPTDSIGLKRVINVPARGIGKTTIEKLEAYQNSLNAEQALTGGVDVSFWDALVKATQDNTVTSAGTAKKLSQFVAMMERFTQEQPKLRLSELYHLILDETGYVRELRKEGTDEALSRVENLEEFDTVLQEFEEDFFEKYVAAQPEMAEERKKELLPLFVEQSTLASDADQLDSLSSSIKLMTLHASKGLEFPVAFLVGMEEGLFPSVKQWEEEAAEDIEEERRLCYVGMTRAREQLFLSSVAVRRFWGNVNFQEPSRFFEEIPAHLMEVKDFSPVGDTQRFIPRTASVAPLGGAPKSLSSLGGTYGGSKLTGKRLYHPEYGDGTIVGEEGSGNEQKVTVEFSGKQRRKFLYRYVSSYLN